jgi:tRNA (adenine22-N1)-methyltransferase
MIKLTPRLKAVASLVRQGRRLADIGTDHAYLPAYLVLKGVVPSAIASDLREGPLDNARATVRENGIENQIELRISDGFDCLYYSEADDYVLAGMGGILMSELLSRAEWLKNPDLHLILQPQSHAEYVRRFLSENGFEIQNEICVNEGERLYIAFDAYFTGRAEKRDYYYYYFGTLPDNEDENSKEYVQRLTARLEKEKQALKESGHDYSHIDSILRGDKND